MPFETAAADDSDQQDDSRNGGGRPGEGRRPEERGQITFWSDPIWRERYDLRRSKRAESDSGICCFYQIGPGELDFVIRARAVGILQDAQPVCQRAVLVPRML